jgi:hypothetical protein
VSDSGHLPSRLSRLVSEPLVVFALIAAGLFGYDAALSRLSPADDADGGTILVSSRLVSALVDDFAWLEGRPPTAAERDELIRDWLDTEILFREALERDMHVSDGKTRARLVDKMRLLWAGAPEPPAEEVLLQYYLDHIERYYTEPTVTFDQVFFEAPASDPAADRAVLAALAAGEPVAGDGFWMGDRLENYAESILRANFGGEFYQALSTAPPGQWIGPLTSPRGRHFVRVESVTPPEPIPYEQIRRKVREDWTAAASRQRIAAKIAELEDRYQILVEQPDA